MRLEQGRAPRPSAEVLAGIAAALYLDDTESDHLHALAGTAPARSGVHRRDVRPSILTLLERLPQTAGIVMSAAFEVLAWNDLAAALMEDFGALAPRDRNLARKAFLGTEQPSERLYGISDDVHFRHSAVNELRTALTRYPTDETVSNLVTELRDQTVPPAIKGTDSSAYVGGLTAGYVDLADRISASLPWLIAVVLTLSFLLLLLAFRSVALPAQAAVMNLLSVGASYGILTFVFQDGHGVSLLGLPGPVPVVSYVPLMMFAILFGLSMDYEVFLLSRIRERYDGGANTHDAVVGGLAASAKVITAAASIMVVVFGAFLLNDDPTIKQFGLGMAVAVLIDATIVRCLLVPSLMVLMGKANWWLPGWLDRILPPLGLDEVLDTDKPAGAPAPESSPA